MYTSINGLINSAIEAYETIGVIKVLDTKLKNVGDIEF